jgi:hypothetical protein
MGLGGARAGALHGRPGQTRDGEAAAGGRDEAGGGEATDRVVPSRHCQRVGHGRGLLQVVDRDVGSIEHVEGGGRTQRIAAVLAIEANAELADLTGPVGEKAQHVALVFHHYQPVGRIIDLDGSVALPAGVVLQASQSEAVTGFGGVFGS